MRVGGTGGEFPPPPGETPDPPSPPKNLGGRRPPLGKKWGPKAPPPEKIAPLCSTGPPLAAEGRRKFLPLSPPWRRAGVFLPLSPPPWPKNPCPPPRKKSVRMYDSIPFRFLRTWNALHSHRFSFPCPSVLDFSPCSEVATQATMFWLLPSLLFWFFNF